MPGVMPALEPHHDVGAASQPVDGGAPVELHREWDAIKSFAGWPDGADSVLDHGDGVDRFTFDGTTMAMMFDGAIGGFSFLCREPQS